MGCGPLHSPWVHKRGNQVECGPDHACGPAARGDVLQRRARARVFHGRGERPGQSSSASAALWGEDS